MRASELIERLGSLVKEFGDVPVVIRERFSNGREVFGPARAEIVYVVPMKQEAFYWTKRNANTHTVIRVF